MVPKVFVVNTTKYAKDKTPNPPKDARDDGHGLRTAHNVQQAAMNHPTSQKMAPCGRSVPICSVMPFICDSKKQPASNKKLTHIAMACNNNFCTLNQAKAKLPAICPYTSCHVKIPTAVVSARSALG